MNIWKQLFQQKVLKLDFSYYKSPTKEMLPVYDKPTIQYVIEEAISWGIDDILISTGRNKRSIEDYFDKSYEFEYTLQNAGKDRVKTS